MTSGKMIIDEFHTWWLSNASNLTWWKIHRNYLMCMHKVIQILEKLFILSRCMARIPKLVSTLPVFHELMAKKAKNACMAFECTFNWHLSHNQLSAIPLKVWTMNAKTPMIIYSMFVTSCWPCHRLKSHTCLNKLHGFISALTTGVWHVWRKTKGDRRLVTDTQAMHNCTCLKCDNIYDNLIKHVCDESEARKTTSFRRQKLVKNQKT